MYKKINIKQPKTTLNVNQATEGETIETKVRRIVNNKEPITDGAPIIFTDRVNGVQPEYNIRTDRFELAIDAMDKITADKLAKRENYIKQRTTDQKDATGSDTGPMTGGGEATK